MRLVNDGFGMEYDDRGRGVPLLFVHGYPLDRTLWGPQLSALSDKARVIVPDLRGFGESSATPGPYSMELLADDLSRLLDSMGVVEQVILCGLSMGGYVTLAFQHKYSERVAGLILTATKAGPDSPEGKAGRDKSAALAREKGPTAIAEGMLPKLLSPKSYTTKPDVVAHARRMMEHASVDGIVGALMGMKERPDSTPTLGNIDRPVLILHGADDQVIPVSEAETMSRQITKSQFRRLPDAGHLLNLEQPDAFNSVVRDFLGKF